LWVWLCLSHQWLVKQQWEPSWNEYSEMKEIWISVKETTDEWPFIFRTLSCHYKGVKLKRPLNTVWSYAGKWLTTGAYHKRDRDSIRSLYDWI
jgi:hypothetical protein